MPTLYLIDGYAQFFRAFHAIRTPMTSPVTQEPTNMTFGFVGLLLKLLRGESAVMRDSGQADYVAVALDVSGDHGTFRSQLYPEYKAQRPEIPEALPPQIDRAMSLLEAMRVPLLGAEGFEADDVIATVVRRLRAERPDVAIRIISKDKDLKQLLETGAVEMYDAHHDSLITETDLMDEHGIAPAQVIDMLALMGDTVDNVPGAEGVGPKTAAQLIAQFGTLDSVIAEAVEDKPKKDWVIKGKRREKIAAAAEQLPLSKTLVTLRDDVPLEFSLDDAAVGTLDLPALAPILQELGFNRYRTELAALTGAAQDAQSEDAPKSTKKRDGADLGLGTLFEQAAPAAAAREAAGITTRVVRTKSELNELVAAIRSAPLIAVDTETTSTRPMRADLVGISVATKVGEGWYVPVRSPTPDDHPDQHAVLGALKPLLEDAGVPKVGHNLKYDTLVLRRHGVTLRGHLPTPDHAAAGDTMIASYLIDASRSSHSMDALAIALLDHRCIPISDLIGSGKNQRTFDTVPLDHAGPYAAEDAEVTFRLNAIERPRLSEMGLDALYSDLEMPLLDVLAELEWNGVLVDPDELDRQRERLDKEIERLKTEIREEADTRCGRGFDPDSPKQLAGVLFNKPDDADAPGIGLRPLKRGKTGPSTDAEVLQKLADDTAVETTLPDLILEYRQLTKLVNTYLGALKDEIHPETKRIHASFNQTVAATGRLSSSDPNLQNIPIRTDLGREIRKAFVAPEGRTLITADYSQIELRLLAHLSRDPALIEAFRRGEDIHRAVAAQIHGVALDDVTREQRSGAKMVNFGIVYGITAFGLARRLGVSNSEADEIITGYKAKFAGITTFLEECVAFARDHGYVETVLKRRRPIHGIDARNPNERALAERMAINSVVQGSAADLIKLAMVDLHARLQESTDPSLADVLMLLQIHDELVFEAPEPTAHDAEQIIVNRMSNAMQLDVPLVVDSAVSKDWFGGK